jgi:phospholipase/carboxylesterase
LTSRSDAPALDDWPHRRRPARGTPEGLVVLFHGRGADELDLLPLLDELDPDRRLVGITPRGPLSLPPGGAHWYVVRRVGYPDPGTFFETFARVSRWLDALPGALGVPWAQTVLGGFSMGAVMSYSLAFGEGRPAPAAVLALSGFLPTVEGFALDLRERRGFPVAIGHGAHDPVIPVEFARHARRLLEAAGLRISYRESPMPHAIDPTFVRGLRSWVLDALRAAGSGGPPP